MSSTLISIVVPTFNEEERIASTLGTIARYFEAEGFRAEIVVADDGSTDGTHAQVKQADTLAVPVRWLASPRNRGKGHAVRRGMLAATGEYVLFTDADLSTPIDEFGRFLPLLRDGHPMVIGSRRLATARVLTRQPLHRQWMGRVFSWLARRLLHPDISDFTCGFKAFRRAAVADLFGPMTLHRWSFDAELLHIARRRGLAVRELPVRWTNRENTRVRLLRDVWTSGGGLVLVVWRGWRGAYDRQPSSST